MSEPFIGELRYISFNFAPKGWALCNGQVLPIAQNQALFAILGTTYGGNGTTTFQLPDLRGRAPIHVGASFSLGQKAGEESHALSIPEMAAHNHPVMATSNAADSAIPATRVLGKSAPDAFQLYSPSASSLTALRAGTVGTAGAGQGHPNMQPYLVVNAVIALTGIFPSRN